MIEKPYTGSYVLTTTSLAFFIERHRIAISIGYTTVPGDTPPDRRWYAFLPDEKVPIGQGATGRGSTPDNAVLDLFHSLSGKTLALDYDFGRAHLTLTLPPFAYPEPSTTPSSAPSPSRMKRTARPSLARRRA